MDTSVILLLLIIIFIVLIAFIIYPVVIIPREIKQAELDKLSRMIIMLVLGVFVSVLVFLSTTRLATETTFESPPHGIVSGVWDNFETDDNGMLFLDINTEKELLLDDLVLRQLARERYLRYLRPPFLRKSCYTGKNIACEWANVDIANFEDSKEWGEFLTRLIIGIITGMATGFIILKYTKEKR